VPNVPDTDILCTVDKFIPDCTASHTVIEPSSGNMHIPLPGGGGGGERGSLEKEVPMVVLWRVARTQLMYLPYSSVPVELSYVPSAGVNCGALCVRNYVTFRSIVSELGTHSKDKDKDKGKGKGKGKEEKIKRVYAKTRSHAFLSGIMTSTRAETVSPYPAPM
jgi:hypothetical protein